MLVIINTFAKTTYYCEVEDLNMVIMSVVEARKHIHLKPHRNLSSLLIEASDL